MGSFVPIRRAMAQQMSYKELQDEPVMGIVEPNDPPAYTPRPQPGQVVPPQVVYVVQQVPQPGWQAGIFDCFRSLPNCLNAWCFPCWRTALSGGRSGVLPCSFLFAITMGLWLLMMINDSMYKRALRPEMQNVIDKCPNFANQLSGDDQSMDVSDADAAACAEAGQQLLNHVLPYIGAFFCLIAAKLLISCTVRGRIRAKYQIPGSACEDMCCHMFCHTCAVAQEGYTVDMLELGRPSPFSLSADVAPVATVAASPQALELGQVTIVNPGQLQYQP